MNNNANKELLDGRHVDFRSAAVALKQACLHELRQPGTVDDETAKKVFQRSVDDCDKAIEIYDELYPAFKTSLGRKLRMFQLDDFIAALEADDYRMLGF